MARFHINPGTGNAGVCKAVSDGCPFGSDADHFDSRGEARAKYESQQQLWAPDNWSSKVPITDIAEVLATFYPNNPYASKESARGNTAYSKFSDEMTDAENGARLVMENGQIWVKVDFDSWNFSEGKEDPKSELKLGNTVSSLYLTTPILNNGARLEKE